MCERDICIFVYKYIYIYIIYTDYIRMYTCTYMLFLTFSDWDGMEFCWPPDRRQLRQLKGRHLGERRALLTQRNGDLGMNPHWVRWTHHYYIMILAVLTSSGVEKLRPRTHFWFVSSSVWKPWESPVTEFHQHVYVVVFRICLTVECEPSYIYGHPSFGWFQPPNFRA